MTIDKIKHYIGIELINFLSSLSPQQLQKIKIELLQDIELLKTKSENNILFNRNIELRFINYLLS